MNRTEVKTMDDLPELPFEKVLSYLSLEDRLKSRAVSRRWYNKIDSFKAKSLCYSDRPSDFIWGKSRLVSGAFARNFISSSRFEWFFNTFGQSILFNLKHLRLCHLDLDEVNGTTLARTLNSFGQLEELALFRFGDPLTKPKTEFELNLPMLNSLQLEGLYAINTLTLDAPRLRKVKLVYCSFHLRVNLVHGESVERLLTANLEYTAVKNLKNLQYLHTGYSAIYSTLLSGLDQLKEFHLANRSGVRELFEQKRRYGLADLKFYLDGLLLNGPDDPAIDSLSILNQEFFAHLALDPSRLADEIPFYGFLYYSAIERVAPGSEANLMSRFTSLSRIEVDRPVQDIERFLDVLKNSVNIVELDFQCAQPQVLFDRLPGHCAIQKLTIHVKPSGFAFLSRLNHLTELRVDFSIDTELIRKLFEGLPFLSYFGFEYNNKRAIIVGNSAWTHPKRFQVWLGFAPCRLWTDVADLNAAIQLVVGTTP